MPARLLEDGNQCLRHGNRQHGANTRAICVKKHGPKHPLSPHHEFVTVAAVGLQLLRFSFLRFDVKPTRASEATSSSNKRHALSNVLQNKSMSSANRNSNKGLRPSSRDHPSDSIFARHEDKTIFSTELNKRGLSRHPWRTPPRILNPQLSASCSLTTPVCP